MKIFDCFLFFNELELLDLRLATLDAVVDHFVLVEANKTFTDRRKDFIFDKNKNRYKKYLDKIIYVRVNDTPAPDGVWTIENFQRNCITRGLTSAKTGDKIIISDVDEIPNPAKIFELKETDSPVTLNQYLFYYFVNCLSNRTWNGPIITPFENMMPPQELRRLAKRGYNQVKGGGWHYSYLGGLERIKSKLDNLSDAYTRRDQVGDDDDILRKVNSQKDLWDEGISHRLVDIGEGNFAPKGIKKFVLKYPYVYYNHAS